ncbi:MAG: peptide chain release factor 1 [Oligoflexia bacterium]|nr:peptide chain release factor 1 [Oligoflexia bacterium]
MFQKLEEVEKRFDDLERKLQDPSINANDIRTFSKEHSDLRQIVESYREFKKCQEDLISSKELLADNDAEMRSFAKEEVSRLELDIERLTKDLNILLLPKDPNDDRNVILEVRAGTGGDEAALFAYEMYRMYQRYADKNNWRVEVLSTNATGLGGIKEISALISGDKVYSKLKNEGGVHRVQRVPDTETQGRVHTSTVTVAVLPEAEEVDVEINPADLRIDVMRASGSGGQSVNTTDSAVRIVHIPTGVEVKCQDEKSQHKNRDKAMKILRSRLLEAEIEKAAAEQSSARRLMVGTGDRSERIRTYNFPQSRCTDHRIGLTLHSLNEIMEGDLDQVVEALVAHTQAELLKNSESVL